MAGHECYHCKQWVEDGEAHDCWTTTEAALTQDLPEDLQEAWERLHEAAVSFGEQRIYASHHSIMFSRKACYFFVRPKRSRLELCVFLGRRLNVPQVKRIAGETRHKVAHLFHVKHRDEVEAPLTDWLQEAYRLEDALAAAPRPRRTTKRPKPRPKHGRTKSKPRARSMKQKRSR